MSAYATLRATTPADTPEITAAELARYIEDHTDLSPDWLIPGRREAGEGRIETSVSANQKYTVEGLEAAAAALSAAHPRATVKCRQEWSEDEIGGEAATYENGQLTAREELSWHPVPITGS